MTNIERVARLVGWTQEEHWWQRWTCARGLERSGTPPNYPNYPNGTYASRELLEYADKNNCESFIHALLGMLPVGNHSSTTRTYMRFMLATPAQILAAFEKTFAKELAAIDKQGANDAKA